MYKVRIGVYSVRMTKDRILSAAKAVLESEGIGGLTIRRVAQRAELSPMALYRHFADKDALLNALMEDGIAAWEGIARGIRARDPMEWLAALGEALLDFALTQPHRHDAAFFLPAPAARRFPDDFAAGRSPVMAMVMARIDEAKADGRIRDRPTLEIALALAASGQGFISMHRAKRFASDKQFKALYRAAQRHFLESIKSCGVVK
ncbi:MAG TPA: TetR/AcrR family transcriptional regulator [Steroidobacteraceae bacterium]|nr:TetR/AcrR family transcriptional regulator [Steroidobacteraceae bacterium]